MLQKDPKVILPANIAAERSVLGALIEHEDLLPEVVDTGLSADDFLLSDHQRIFRSILALHNRNCPVDYITVTNELGNRQEDYVLVASLIHGVVLHDEHTLHHVTIVMKKSCLRALLKLSEWISRSVSSSADPDALIQEISRRIEQCRIR